MVKTFRMTLSCVLLSLPFAGCDNGSTTVDSSHDSNRQVSLSATTMRSSIVDGDEVLSEGAFKVLAWQRDSTEVSSGVFTYTDNLWVGTQTSGGDYLPETVWFQGASGGQKPWATLPTYYWPVTFVACDFYAIYPTTAPNIEELPREGSARPMRYIDYDNNDRQTDLLLAATTTNSAQAAADASAAGGTDGMAKLLFHHVLTRVSFKAQRDTQTPGPQLNVTVKSVELCNIRQMGTFKFQNLPNSPGVAPLLGIWSLRGSYKDLMLYNDATGVTLTDAETAYTLTDATTSATLIPQRLTGWDITQTITENNSLATPGAYLKIGCSITIDGYNGNFADEGFVYVPFNANLTMNKHYEYTLHFGGGYDHEGHLILQPIYITNTVVPWATGISEDIDPGWL